MDCFYAAVEIRDHPEWRNKPLAVGGAANRRGVLCTSNYIAREYGVRSAMATAHALRLCPDLILVPPSFVKYREISQNIREIFQRYTDLIEPLSLDEAYLDVSQCTQFQGSATLIAESICREILQTQQLTASAGIAPNKFLAKIASDWQKPNGQFVIRPEQIADFVAILPVKKIFGVGKVTAEKMRQFNIKTCGDLQQCSLIELRDKFGSFGEQLHAMCRGHDEREVQPNRVRKSLSVEHTYPQDLPDLNACKLALPALWDELKKRLEKHDKEKIHKQFLKLKFLDFQQTTVETVITDLNIDTFYELLEKGFARQNKAVRLLGVGVGFDNEQNELTMQEQFKF